MAASLIDACHERGSEQRDGGARFKKDGEIHRRAVFRKWSSGVMQQFIQTQCRVRRQ